MSVQFPPVSEETRVRMLQPPKGRVKAVLDTDTFNEIDDQFAVVYALLSPEKIDLQAIYAAPYFNEKSTGPKDGMEKSYEEIHRILSRMGVEKENYVFRGSEEYLPKDKTPVLSPAAEDLVKKARTCTSEDPLYVLAIGAITNVASALLMAPDIVDKIVIVWLGGHALHWPDTREFNLIQDVTAAQVVFDCGAPVVQLPCMGVVDHMLTTLPEINTFVKGRGAIGDFLAQRYFECSDDHFAYSRVIWDPTVIAWLVCPEGLVTQLRHSPIVTLEGTYSEDCSRHLYGYVSQVNRDRIFGDLFRRLQAHAQKEKEE